MDPRYAQLHRFFAGQAKHLQREIDDETKRAGGEGRLSAREDRIQWVYDARARVRTYWTICRMLEEKAMGMDDEKVIQSLSPNLLAERYEIERIRLKQEEEKQALRELKAEAEVYRLALEVLGK